MPVPGRSITIFNKALTDLPNKKSLSEANPSSEIAFMIWVYLDCADHINLSQIDRFGASIVFGSMRL